MKRIVYGMLIFALSFCFIGNVFAKEVEIRANVDKSTVVKGNEVSFKINLKSSDKIVSCQFKFESDNGLEYISSSGANGWQVMDGASGVLAEYPNFGNISYDNGLNIMEVKFKANETGRVVIKTLECASEDEVAYENVDDVGVQFTVEEKQDDTSIKEIVVAGGAVSYNGKQYVINLKTTTFGLNIVTNNPEYQNKIVVKDKDGKEISDISNITFNDPSGQGNMYLVAVVNGTASYDILVKYQNDEYNNNLKKVMINGKELVLTDGQYTYTYKVSKDTTVVEVTPELNDSENFKLEGNYSGKHSFSNNEIHLVIDVVPKDTSSGAKKVTYVIEIVKEGTTPSNPGNSGNSNSIGSGTNVNKNPGTSDVPMFMMAFILIVSLIGSVFLYRKNLQSYK